MVAPNYGGYNCAIQGMMDEIARLSRAIETWDLQLARHLQAKTRAHIEALREMAADEIKALTELHGAVTRFCSIPALRAVGWALHSSPIKVNVQAPNRRLGFHRRLRPRPRGPDKENFPGNQLYLDKFHSVFPPCSPPPFCPELAPYASLDDPRLARHVKQLLRWIMDRHVTPLRCWAFQISHQIVFLLMASGGDEDPGILGRPMNTQSPSQPIPSISSPPSHTNLPCLGIYREGRCANRTVHGTYSRK